ERCRQAGAGSERTFRHEHIYAGEVTMPKEKALLLWLVLLFVVTAIVQGMALIRHGFSARDAPFRIGNLRCANHPETRRSFRRPQPKEPVHGNSRSIG